MQDAYKIGIMETQASPSDTADNIITLTAAATIGGAEVDHTTRLRELSRVDTDEDGTPDAWELPPIISPLAAAGSNVGVVYAFLPGDDAAAAATTFSMLWGTGTSAGTTYPSELAASLTYTFDLVSMPDTTYNLRIEKVTELTRLPANIRTRARRGKCDTPGTPTPIPLASDSVSCDEDGPAVTGQGFYLIYSPSADKIRVRLDTNVRDNPRFIINTSPDNNNNDDDGDELRDTTSFTFHQSRDCVRDMGITVKAFLPDETGESPEISLGSDDQIYCIELFGAAADSNVASDNLQFTLHPQP